MDDIVKEYMHTGKDLNTILNNRIKANDRKWILTFILFSIIWVGYIGIVNQRNTSLVEQNNLLKHDRFVSDSIIEMQKEKLNSAVYFVDMK